MYQQMNTHTHTPEHMHQHTHTHIIPHTCTCQPPRFPHHTIPFRWVLFTIPVRFGSKISIDELTHTHPLGFVYFYSTRYIPRVRRKTQTKVRIFCYFHRFLCATNKPHAITGIRDGIWGGCQFLGEYVCVCVSFSARVTRVDNSQ